LAGDFGLADTGGEQLGGLWPASLQAVTVSLCRMAARSSSDTGLFPLLRSRSCCRASGYRPNAAKAATHEFVLYKA